MVLARPFGAIWWWLLDLCLDLDLATAFRSQNPERRGSQTTPDAPPVAPIHGIDTRLLARRAISKKR